MADALPTIWHAEAHTRAKHDVLCGYLKAWFPILTHQGHSIGSDREILYIDGFAGPGEYENNILGSPILAIEAAKLHIHTFKKPIKFLFVENRPDRCDHLKSKLEPYKNGAHNIGETSVYQGDCNEIINRELDKVKQAGKQFGPALAFLDQFGYAGVSMKLVQRILSVPQCESFIYLDYKDMNRFITDDSKATGFTKTFGSEDWKAARAMPDAQRKNHLLECYLKALHNHGSANYVFPFSMFDDRGVLLYWLIFCTNSLRGLEEMKKAMWTVDRTGNFRFSDRESPDQLTFLDQAFDQDWLAASLAKSLVGKELLVKEVKEYVLTKTPCYLYKKALVSLERCNALQPVDAQSSRVKYQFPDENLKVKFTERTIPKKRETGSLFDE